MKKISMAALIVLFMLVITACGLVNTPGEKRIEFIDTGDRPIESYMVEAGERINILPTPTFLNYEFGGWFEDSRYTKPWDFDKDVVKKNTKLYAKWTTTITQTVSVQKGTNANGEIIYDKKKTQSTINVNPRVVVTFALEIADIFKMVGFENTGITYFGLPKANLPKSINQFASNAYPNTGTLFEPTYDTLDLMLPDLIIIGGRSANLYETLKSRYPQTDIIDVSNTTFTFEKQTEVFETLKLIFPKISEMITEYQETIQVKLNSLQSKMNGQNALFLQVNGDQISVFGLGSRYGVIYNEFKFTPSDPDLKTLEAHGNIVTYEYVSKVNPQVIFLMDRTAATETNGSTGAIDQIKNNALVKNTMAGKNSDIYILDPMSWYILPGGIESTLKMIEDISQLFTK